jgi:hypothetical protein
LENKKLVAIAVGIAPEESAWSKKSYGMIPKSITERIEYFKIPGKIWIFKPAGKVSKENLKKIVEYVES